jgi:H+/Cl- antiporter ClcA
VIGLITFPHPIFRHGVKEQFSAVLHINMLSPEFYTLKPFGSGETYYSYGNIVMLLYAFLARFIIFIIVSAMPTPYGVNISAMMLGSVFGRLYGEVINTVFGF